jgi:hypothetical protein
MEETVIIIGLSIAIGLLLIGNLGILIFGGKNIINGKHKPQQIAFFFIPVLVFAISYLVTGNLQVGAILTLIIMIILMFLGILLSGSRSLISNF